MTSGQVPGVKRLVASLTSILIHPRLAAGGGQGCCTAENLDVVVHPVGGRELRGRRQGFGDQPEHNPFVSGQGPGTSAAGLLAGSEDQ